MSTNIHLGGPSDIYAITTTGQVWNCYWQRIETQPEVVAAVRAKASEDAAKREAQVSEASTLGRRTYVRRGLVPESGRSWNHMDNYLEAGVSVYDAWVSEDRIWIDLRAGVSLGVVMFSSQDFVEVSGRRIDATGADNEPLLADAHMIRSLAGHDMEVIL